MRVSAVVRIGMGLLGAVHAWWGLWALIAPQHFFDTFPGFGRRWTAAYPPYNEHLVTDLGGTFLTLAFLLVAGAAWPRRPGDRAVRTVALSAVIIFSALHLGFHAGHHGELIGADYSLSVVTLALGVVVPGVLLLIDRRSSDPAR